MRKLLLLVFAVVCLAVLSAFHLKKSDSTPGGAENFDRIKNKHRGVSWVAGRRTITDENFVPIAKSGVNWIIQTPFGWQAAYNKPELQFHTDRRVMWGERDIGIETTTKIARDFNIRIILKPHIWLRRSGGKWRADIKMENEADWKAWFASYERFILHYAQLAERLNLEGLCIGTELYGTVHREENWRAIIKAVRQVYSGKLVYAANWYEEFEAVKFWDDLDYIGLQAYYPLSDRHTPTVEELKASWKPHVKTLHNLSKKYGKPVLFTEIGYRSTPDCAIEPWRWLTRNERREGGEAAQQAQANCYEAFFQTFWHQDWFAGAYFWKWYPNHTRAGGADNLDFTPQNKMAQEVMTKWYVASGE